MSKYRNNLPQLKGGLFLSDGGLETTLIFHQGIELPHFASFDLLRTQEGVGRLRDYYRSYLAIAQGDERGFILDSPTWRANEDWGAKLGYSDAALDAVNRQAIELMVELRDAYETKSNPIVIGGCIGPRGDGYNPGATMSADEAEAYHAAQIGTFAETEADMVGAMTMTYAEEAIGIARAAKAASVPAVISFTLETDGRLPTRQSLGEAIQAVDAATQAWPAYYMINCAHPTHFARAIVGNEAWCKRLRGLRANASRRSHAELDSSPDLDEGNPIELGDEYRAILKSHPWINVLGGCCGTDHRHVEAISHACRRAA